MADDLGGHPLAHLALGLGIDRQREIGMGLDVDEARRHREARCVDGLRRLARQRSADRCNAAVRDSDVLHAAGAAAAVEDAAVADEDVVGHRALLLLRTPRGGRTASAAGLVEEGGDRFLMLSRCVADGLRLAAEREHLLLGRFERAIEDRFG